MTDRLKLYGIPNCDTIKKARNWLTTHDVSYDFHDYKKQGINETLLSEWIAKVGWESLLNRRGMMWRKLGEDERSNINDKTAIKLMLSTPTIIKRPVLVSGDSILVGFNQDEYEAFL